MKKRRVLFICTGNSARSQMAEGLVNHFLGDCWQAHSGGTQPAGYVHPLAVEVMAELGIDISSQRPKSLDDFRHIDLDLVITLCDDAAQNCPLWLGKGKVVHISLPDPAQSTATEAERTINFRKVRDEIRQKVLGYLRDWDDTLPASNEKETGHVATDL